MKFAIISNNLIETIMEVESEAELSAKLNLRSVQGVIDITDQVPEPQVGWALIGSELMNQTPPTTSDEHDAYQQKAQRQKGEQLCKKATDLVGARNLKLARELVPVDVALLASQMLSLKTLLEGGALKTVRGLCLAMKAAHPNHADILQSIVDEITEFLIKNNWN